MGVRLTVLVGLVSLLYGALVFKLYDVQVQNGEAYKAQAFSQHVLAGLLDPVRGNIYFTDRSGNSIPAAISKEYPTIYVNPKEVGDDKPRVVEILNALGVMEEDEIESILAKKNDLYESIVKRATDEQVSMVTESNIKAVDVDYKRSRLYPLATIASHILGFVSADENVGGAYGIESEYQDRLRGQTGVSSGDKVVSRAETGKDLDLTIDLNIQREAEKILGNLVEKYKAEQGLVIVQNPKTGAILTMAATPNFDPNTYNEFSISTFLNPNVESVYEPGSIFKMITMASALDAGKITPETTYNDTGSLVLNGKTIRNWDLKAHGVMTMTQVIEKSLNTGAAFAERALGPEDFYDYLVKFGLKDKTGIDLPGEVVGSLRPLEVDKRDVNFATASFGQGISVTPIGLLRAMSAIANHGVMMKPYLNAEKDPEEVGRIISEDASRKTVGMMVNAVNIAQIAKIQNYNVAGKTGTAQIPARGGYTDDVINTYVGFAPAYNPKFIILIRMDKPAGAPLAGLTVVPAFRDLAQFILNYYNVPPDNL